MFPFECLKVREVENCIVCILRPCVEFAPWLMPYKGYCEHTEKTYSEKPQFKKLKGYWWIYIIIPLTTLALLWNLYYMSRICSEDSVTCLLLVTDELTGFYGVSFYIVIWMNSRFYLAATNITCDISSEWSKFGNGPLVSPNDRKQFRLRFRLVVVAIYISYSIIIHHFYMLIQHYGFNCQSFSKMIVLGSSIIQITVNSSLILQSSLNHFILRAIYIKVQVDLSDEVESSKLALPQGRNINAHARMCKKMALMYRYLNEYLNPTFLIFLITSVAILIINIYIFITPWSVKHLLEIRSLQWRTGLLIVMLFVNVTEVDLQQMNEDVLSFLFKYPISKLTRQEAAQVEMLVATLILQKPVVRASDTITIGRRLLASISGTVLTYVLVALQFRAAWSET
nr:uncharacterized protein LOC111511034 [Leptinotarsa decemlineata]